MESISSISSHGSSVVNNKCKEDRTSADKRIQAIDDGKVRKKVPSEIDGTKLKESGCSDIGLKRCHSIVGGEHSSGEVSRKIPRVEQKSAMLMGNGSVEPASVHVIPDVLISEKTGCHGLEIFSQEQIEPPAIKAINEKKYDQICVELENGFDPNECSYHGCYPLHWVAEQGDEQMLNIFCNRVHGLDMDIRAKGGDTPLMIAVNNKYIKFSQLLIQSGADIDMLDSNSCNILFGVLNWPRDKICPEGRISPFIKDIIKRMSSEVIMSPRDVDGQTIMHVAADRDEPEVLIEILKKDGINFNIRDFDNRSPLQDAFDSEAWYLAGLLLEAGALDINKRLKNDSLPLKAAVEAGEWFAAGELIKLRADGVNELLDNGNTVFMQAMLEDECDCTEHIAANGYVDLGKIFGNGKTHRQLVWDAFEELRDELEEGSFTPQDVCNVLRSDDS
ncbi:ankyrin repeat domain-containing protein [Endozoicomonas elysicola]|uniref:Uncharacterized protein n=1 Tax=Endozoicomonas elysicola TaxID=305900 RepID=A0A081KGK6_9GAMM|nr:ankyrin repeat domain-containing protein [Endozoicomonas elysicola]KEI73282.1 hypothetical protein GV64_23475 [Endozoicomonas elysicola]